MNNSKIIIVDDEVKIVQLIEALIDWESLSLNLVGTANDGITALELIKDQIPAIVILDMKMPGFNGIELICRAKDINPNIHFIIISGYRRFEYAQSAIKYGVEDYLLKPVKEDELNNTLKKVIQKIENKISNEDKEEHYQEIENRALEDNLFKLLLKSETELIFDLDLLKNDYNIDLKHSIYEVVLVKNDLNVNEVNDNEIVLLQEKTDLIVKRILDNEELIYYKFRSSEGLYILLNYSSNLKDSIRDTLIIIIEQLYTTHDLFINLKTTIARSGGFDVIGLIYNKMLDLSVLIKDRVISGGGTLLSYENSYTSKINLKDIYTVTLKNNLVKHIDILDESGIKKILDNIQVDLLSMKMEIRGQLVFDITDEILETFLFSLKNRSVNPKSLEQQIMKFKHVLYIQSSIPSLFSLLTSKLLELILAEKKSHKDQIAQPIVDVKKYINDNFFMNLSLDSVSSFVGMNPTYFSTLFKKETGVGFLEYLTEVRMEEAKELLSDPKRLISDTASEVGYKDTKHFTKQFKKIVGLSPIEYRKIYY